MFSANASGQPTFGPARLLLTTQDWPPYQSYQQAQMQGLAVDKVKCALSHMGQPYQLTMTVWSDAQLRVQSGNQHGFFVATQTAERDEYATISDPIAQQRLRWYFGPGVDPKINELTKVNLKFSAKFGSSKWFWLKRNGFNVVKQPRDANVLLKLLKQREIDVALEDEKVFGSELNEATLPEDFFPSQVMETKPMGVYFSNRFLTKYSGFLSAFNTAISTCEGVVSDD
ncbi:transporter substrate-binding domain-containing protein [Vibrio ostreicida]|uniref:Transporter substrate-binding domain-containing protein n=2 Tax=Vibrio ostreicida TaxID=526588 RepID=A0ABT8BT22_9VIBR|nr:transporter substrate-binding domain-containing protein [Vibrio ostreicida]MDN3610126.1 transporter substrate-binding domain-containing protein [Vibrio ostreicida]